MTGRYANHAGKGGSDRRRVQTSVAKAVGMLEYFMASAPFHEPGVEDPCWYPVADDEVGSQPSHYCLALTNLVKHRILPKPLLRKAIDELARKREVAAEFSDDARDRHVAVILLPAEDFKKLLPQLEKEHLEAIFRKMGDAAPVSREALLRARRLLLEGDISEAGDNPFAWHVAQGDDGGRMWQIRMPEISPEAKDDAMFMRAALRLGKQHGIEFTFGAVASGHAVIRIDDEAFERIVRPSIERHKKAGQVGRELASRWAGEILERRGVRMPMPGGWVVNRTDDGLGC